MKERLQKILARAGHGSRRSAETVITAGRVSINGTVVSELGSQADPEIDVITVDGKPLVLPSGHVYLAMNKPYGVVTTASDPQNRRTVMELLPKDLPPHVFAIGRLDRDTEGLLLFTDDGELAHRLAHPRYRIDKEYFAQVEGVPDEEALSRMRTGIDLGDRVTANADVRIAPAPYGHEVREGRTWVRVVIHEGRKRQVRLMCAAVGHPIRALVRTRIGDITLAKAAKGHVRRLSDREVASLRALVGL